MAGPWGSVDGAPARFRGSRRRCSRFPHPSPPRSGRSRRLGISNHARPVSLRATQAEPISAACSRHARQAQPRSPPPSHFRCRCVTPCRCPSASRGVCVPGHRPRPWQDGDMHHDDGASETGQRSDHPFRAGNHSPGDQAPCSRRSTAFPWRAMATATSGLQPRAAMVRR